MRATWPQRTHTCGELRLAHAGQAVTLNGWVHRRRDQGGLIFIDLRDRYGITQIVINRDEAPEAHEAASRARSEYVLSVSGAVRTRPDGTANPDLATGDVELGVQAVTVLAESKAPPFEITAETNVDESVRLRHRYLDLRRRRLRELIELRHKVVREMREYLWARDFLELETPTLVRSTPEGSRDFVVPSRLHPGNFYALPQSPQQMKQLIMVAGLDRYFQLARCYRDEDLRADRVFEHTQLDIEMAFVEREDLLELIESLYLHIVGKLSSQDLAEVPFPRISHAEAIRRFGTDKPDVRFALELVDVAPDVSGRGFRAFDDAVADGGQVKAVVAPGIAGYSRREVSALQDIVQEAGAAGMATIALNDNGSIRSPLARFFGEDALREAARNAGANQGDLVCIVAGSAPVVAEALGALRLHLGRALDLIEPNQLAFVWIIDFPLFEIDEESGGFTFSHNPFCSPADDSFELLYTDPGRALSKQYDLICNGHEIGGGSIRAHRAKDLRRIYQVMGYSDAEIDDSIGHMLDAFTYGAPPHGGIAMGVDRLAMLLGGTENLRDVTVFPKNQAGFDLMLGAPGPLALEQLDELHLMVRDEQEESPAEE
ncbi:MAG: aspartate--tRNA ligase [Chloroflexi bacterium]|nr:aspartate--tRNA ligase [Chloroflexota bacterium]